MWRWRRTLCSQSLRSTSISQLPFESASNFVSLVSDTPSSKGSGEKSGRCVWQNAPFWNRGQIWENWEWQAGWFLFFSVYTSLLVNVSKKCQGFYQAHQRKLASQQTHHICSSDMMLKLLQRHTTTANDFTIGIPAFPQVKMANWTLKLLGVMIRNISASSRPQHHP